MINKSIKNKPVVLLTGAYTAGMGSAVRKVFHNAGWQVIALYDAKDKMQLNESMEDGLSIKLDVDLMNKNSIESMVKLLPEHINAFVHAAMFFEMDTNFNHSIWSNTLQVNVVSAAQIVEGLRSRMTSGGSIVAISSTEAFTGSFGSAAYSASRAAIHNLVKSWANKLGVDGIRVNAIAAGWIGGIMDTNEIFNKSKKITPLGRLGLPEEVANTVKFLCSPEASFINGSVVTVDGGYSGVDNVSKYEYQEHLAATDFQRFTSEFMVKRAGPEDEIWAVSMMFEGEWKGEEATRFTNDQLEAAKRGAQINRVFVIPREVKSSFNNDNELVKFHKNNKNINGFFIERDILKAKNPELLENLGDGWTALNDEVLILDSASKNGPRGTLVSGGKRIASLRKYFEDLLKLASPITRI